MRGRSLRKPKAQKTSRDGEASTEKGSKSNDSEGSLRLGKAKTHAPLLDNTSAHKVFADDPARRVNARRAAVDLRRRRCGSRDPAARKHCPTENE